MVRRIAFWTAGIFVAAFAAILGYAPYLPRLALEGFPSLVWSGAGTAATIEGVTSPLDLSLTDVATTTALVDDLQEAFDANGGRALLVYRRGHLALEHYGAGTDEQTRLNSYSMAKSLIGALVYKALAEGRLASLDQTLAEFMPADAGIANVSLRSLVTMRAGIHFDGGKSGAVPGKDDDISPNPFGPLARLHFLGLEAVAAGLTAEPAENTLNYQNINTALLGAVLERIYGQPLEALLAEKLWTPAMAQPALWRGPSEDTVSAYCCIYATARDWVRVGIYLMHNGTPDAPFLPAPLWREFMGLDIDPALRVADNYGAHIRQNVLDRAGQALQGPFTYLFGQGGQVLYLMPEQDLVVYRSGVSEQLLHSTLYGAFNSLPVAD